MSKLQNDERRALIGDRAAVVHVVSGLREYREAVKNLITKRWGDGSVDGATMNLFVERVEEIEEAHGDDDDDA